MNRRDFMGTIAGGIAAVKFGSVGLPAYGAETVQARSGSQGAWVQNGLIDAGGDHEPYIFVVRRGGQRLDARQHYEYEQSEELIRLLKDQGVEVFHTHFYKGFGMAAEMPDMEETKKTVAIAHRYGMKVDTYLQWDTMMYETFFVEEPRAQGWIQCDQWGQPIMLEYGYQQSFRYRPCFSNQEYLDYLKKVVRFAVAEVKTDFIHFDNFDLNSEPSSCHCNGCKTGFRQYLRKKYTAQQRKERFGFENVDYVNPPLWNRSNPPEQLDIIFDPAFQEWIDYRCQSMSDALGQMRDVIHSLNPEVAIEINYGGIVGDNNPWLRGTDYARLMPYTQVFWDEQDVKPEFSSDGRLVTTIRTYKLARAYKNVALTNADSWNTATGIGECLAFNQTIGYAGTNPITAEMSKHIAFYKKNRELFVGTEDVASVAVLRSYPSITYHNSRAGLSAILAEQALIQAQIPFHLVFDEDLKHLSSAKFKVLVLPNSECLSDEQLSAIRQFVEGGGGLIATDQAGFYDTWRRLRVTSGLQGLVDHQVPAEAYQEEVKMTQSVGGASTRKEVGQGRVVYIPGLVFDGPMPPAAPYFSIETEFWKRPKNSQDVVDAVYWAARNDVPLQVRGPNFIAANLVELPGKQRRLVHLVNYNVQADSPVENIEVKCAVPNIGSVQSVKLHTVGSESSTTLNFRMQGSYAVFTVPKLSAYCMVEVSW